MKTQRSMRLARPLSVIIGFGILCALPSALWADDGTPGAKQDDAEVMYLGNVEVHGQTMITKTLQAIKAGLDMPLSTDPKLADVVVCRLEKKVGSHITETLICGTNRNLARQRYNLQTAFDLAAAHSGSLQDPSAFADLCSSGGCYSDAFGAFNSFIDGMPRHFLYTTVDGTAFRKLLKQVPMPAAQSSTVEKAPDPTTKAR